MVAVWLPGTELFCNPDRYDCEGFWVKFVLRYWELTFMKGDGLGG